MHFRAALKSLVVLDPCLQMCISALAEAEQLCRICRRAVE